MAIVTAHQQVPDFSLVVKAGGRIHAPEEEGVGVRAVGVIARGAEDQADIIDRQPGEVGDDGITRGVEHPPIRRGHQGRSRKRNQ